MDRKIYQFGPFRVDERARMLLRDGQTVSITPKVFDTLLFLIANAGRTVSREELIQSVWPDTFVEEGNLNYNMSQLRTILGEYEPGVSYIQTVPKRGYRFVVEITQVNDAPGPPGSPTQPPWKHRLVWITSAAVLILATGGATLWRLNLATTRPQQIRSIAVLPLENLSHDPDQDYFAGGLTEVLTTSLAQISALNVIARSSAMHYQGTKKTAAEISRELHVDALVEGAVQRSGGRVLITAQLIEGSSDRHLWAKSFERDVRDVLALQNEVAQAIAAEIRAKLTPQERVRLNTPRPVKPEAREAYLRAVYWSDRDDNKALRYAQQAIQSDPNYAPAQALLANYYAGAVNEGKVPMKEGNAKWRAAVTRALELDDTIAEAHGALGSLLHYHDWNWRDGEKEYQRAIQLNPSLPDTHISYSDLLAALGRTDEAVTEAKRAVQLSPFSPGGYAYVGLRLIMARRYDEAIEDARTTLALPGFTPSDTAFEHHHLAAAYLLKGNPTQAIEEFQHSIELTKDPANRMFSIARLAYVYAVSGRKKEALQQLAVLKEMQGSPNLSCEMAMVYVGLREKDRAFKWLEKAYDERSYSLTFIKVDPRMDSLRSDPRYSELLRRMGLPQ